MAGNASLFYDEKWTEMIFNLLSTLTHEQKLRLDMSELKIVSNKRGLKKFCAAGDFVRQITLLTKVGYDWFFGVYPAGKHVYPIMKKAYTQNAINNTSPEVIQEQLESRVFLIDNKSVAIALAVMSTNNHTELFDINKEFLKTPATLKYLNRKQGAISSYLKGEEQSNEWHEVSAAMNKMREFVAEVFLLDEYMKNAWGLNKIDFLILHHLYQHQLRYVSVDYLHRMLPGISSTSISYRCGLLWSKNNYIDKLPKTDPVSYTIKSDGILLVREIVHYIVNKINKQ